MIDYAYYKAYYWKWYLKRRKLLQILEMNGFEFKRSGGNHDIYQKGKCKIAVPCHKEINENLVKVILQLLMIM